MNNPTINAFVFAFMAVIFTALFFTVAEHTEARNAKINQESIVRAK